MSQETLAKSRVSEVGVADHASVASKEREVSGCEVGTTDMSSTVSPSGLHLVHQFDVGFDSLLNRLSRGISNENCGLSLLGLVVLLSFIVPVELVHLFGALRSHTVLHGQHHKDGLALVVNLATFVDVSGQACIWTIGASCFNGTPFLEGESHIFEGDLLLSEQESDSLGAALESEVNDLCHFLVLFFGV